LRRFLLLCFVAIGAWSNALHAQEEPSDLPAPDGEYTETPLLPANPWRQQLDKLSTRLKLTPAQSSAAEVLFADYHADLADNPPATPELKRARKRALRGRFRQLLTPEQQADLRSGNKGRNSTAPTPKKRHWLDALLDDVATPLIEKRKKNRRNGG